MLGLKSSGWLNLALAVVVLGLSGCFRAPPSHEILTQQFSERHSSFDTLRRMVAEDGISIIGESGNAYSIPGVHWVGPDEVGVSHSRAEEYKRLLRLTDCDRVDVQEDGTVAFSMASWGIANRGWRVSALWSPTIPPKLISNLDAFRKTSINWDFAHSALPEKGWYLRISW